MEKRVAKILVSCVAFAALVLIILIVGLRFSRLTCELVALEPGRLRQAQLDAFQSQRRHKPTRSHDKMLLLKMAAYLEYNVDRKQWAADEESGQSSGVGSSPTSASANNNNNTNTNNSSSQKPPTGPAPAGPSPSGGAQLGAPAAPFSGQSGAPVANKNNYLNQTQLNSSQPSWPAGGRQQHQQQSSSQLAPPQSPPPSAATLLRADKRFLPLELESIQTRSLASDGAPAGGSAVASVPGVAPIQKHQYVVNFNCTKLNMVFVYQANRVWIESMSLELGPSVRGKNTCELQLASSGAFAVDSTLAPADRSKTPANLAHYYCSKPLTYNCYHYSSKSGPSQANGLLLAELHISAIEFETVTAALGLKNEKRHVKHEFKGKRKECDIAH